MHTQTLWRPKTLKKKGKTTTRVSTTKGKENPVFAIFY